MVDSTDWDIGGSCALVSDIERRKALPIIRTLGRHGVRVIGISYSSFPLGRFSKYLDKAYHCPNYRVSPGHFLSYLRQLCEKEKPDVFYPLEDDVLSLCLENPKFWEPYTKALVPTKEVFEKASDKWEAIQIAARIGVPTPRTLCPDNAKDLYEICSMWNGPAVIKPRRSSGSRGLRFVQDSSQMLAAYREVERKYPRPMIQEVISAEGEGLGVFVLINRENVLSAVFGHKRLREFPVTGGPSTLRVGYRNNELIAQTLRLFKELKLVGVAMAEYKMDLKKKQPVLMEINARFWGSLQLAIDSGVNFPVMYHKLALGQFVKPVLEYPIGKVCRWLWPGDLLHFLYNPNRWRLLPDFCNFRDPDVSYDILSRDDVFPAVGILFEALRKLFRRVSGRGYRRR